MSLRRHVAPPVALLLVLTGAGAGGALAAAPVKGAHYAGNTSQAKAISFDISANGKRVVHPIFTLVTHCFGGGNSYAQTSAHSTATVSGAVKQGKFRLDFKEKAKLKGGVVAHAAFHVDGRFTSARHATGTARVTVHYSNGVECVSDPVSFNAKR